MTGLRVPSVRVLAERRTWDGLLYLLLSVPPAVLWLALLGPALLVGGGTAVLGVGLPVLLLALIVSRRAAELERRLLNRLLGAGIDEPEGEDLPEDGGVVTASWTLLRSPRTWRSLAWMLLRSVAAALVLAGGVASAVLLAALLALPFVDGYLAWGGSWRSSSGWASAWAVPVGLAGLLASVHLSRVLVTLHVRVGQLLLGPDPSVRVASLTAQTARAQQGAQLALDLHDSIGHAMTLVVVQAGAARTAVDRDPTYVRSALTGIVVAARTALDELDQALAALREQPGRPSFGLLTDLPVMLDRAAAAGLQVDLDLAADLEDVPAEVSVVAYRIVQEGCTNVLRHSAGQAASVRVTRGPDLLSVGVENDWLAGSAPHGRGLTGATERVHRLGGTLTAGPVGSRWCLHATLPVPARRP